MALASSQHSPAEYTRRSSSSSNSNKKKGGQHDAQESRCLDAIHCLIDHPTDRLLDSNVITLVLRLVFAFLFGALKRIEMEEKDAFKLMK